MQGLKILKILMLFCMLCTSARLNGISFIKIHRGLSVKAPKNTPPYYAYKDLLGDEVDRNTNSSYIKNAAEEWVSVTIKAGKDIRNRIDSEVVRLSTYELASSLGTNFNSKKLYSTKRNYKNEDWYNDLSHQQKARLNHVDPNLLDEGFEHSSWSEHIKDVLEQNGLVSKKEIQIPTTISSDPIPSGHQRIQGPIEMCCGLALTRDHKFTIQRYFEGVPMETGVVNIESGLFHIDIQEPNGEIVATLIDQKGQILGEGIHKLSGRFSDKSKNVISLPTLQLTPKRRFAGSVNSIYKTGSRKSEPPKGTMVYGSDRETPMPISKEGSFEEQRYSSFSSSSMEAEAPNHWKTNIISLANSENQLILFPDRFIEAIENVLNSQRDFNFNDRIETIVWGRVVQDEKPTAGVKVELGNDPTAKVFYLNEFYFPDFNLKETSSSGTYIIVNAAPGYQTIYGKREGQPFGYINVLVQRKSVALGFIKNSIKLLKTNIHIFDAFSGLPEEQNIWLEGLDRSIFVNGNSTIELPDISREGLLFNLEDPEKSSSLPLTSNLKPEANDFIRAQYLYQDSRGYIHIPLVRESWLDKIKNDRKLSVEPGSGVVVGFFGDEDYEVFINQIGEYGDPGNSVVYFDSQGNILNESSGKSGGGFVIFNLPADATNIIILGKVTETVSSRLVPVTPERISILNF